MKKIQMLLFCAATSVVAADLPDAESGANSVPEWQWISASAGGLETDDLLSESSQWSRPAEARVPLRLSLPFNDQRDIVNGVDFALLSSCSTVEVSGMEFGLLAWSDLVYGVQSSVLLSIANEGAFGLQSSVMLNQTAELRGVQLALMNIAYPALISLQSVELRPQSDYRSGGVQLSAFGNAADKFDGFQITALSNSVNEMSGFQLGAQAVAGNFEGIQAGLWTQSEEAVGYQLGALFNDGTLLDGLQFGLVNSIEAIKGVQAGIFNAAQIGGVQIGLFNQASTGGVQIGLLNFMNDGFLAVSPLINFGNTVSMQNAF